ncbi:FAD-dependent oxidoreductase, partial [Desulfosarcina sp.]|uniref:FAD-dependent oxidoreductase n=1 Tax=Desulfosarcina sp. TaxID=2027861 RepID=UPI0039709F20
MTTQTTGSVLVVGGGIAGIQASLDLADAGYRVVLAGIAEDKIAEDKSLAGDKTAVGDSKIVGNV